MEMTNLQLYVYGVIVQHCKLCKHVDEYSQKHILHSIIAGKFIISYELLLTANSI